MRKHCLSYYRLGLCPQDKGGSGRDVTKGVGWDFCFRRNSIEGWWKMSGLYSGVMRACSRQWLGAVRKQGMEGLEVLT